MPVVNGYEVANFYDVIRIIRKSRGEHINIEYRLDDENAGAINYAKLPRSSGSTLKPFVFGLGMTERGFTGATLLNDKGLALKIRRGVYTPQNYDEQFLGPILYRDALANSRNIPALHVLQEVGLNRTYSFFHTLGLVPNNNLADYYGVGMAIGGIYVSLEQLMQAYGVLANDGFDFQLTWFTQKQTSGFSKSLIPEAVARQLTLFLSDPLARLPSFARMDNLEYPFPVAVKTGTSQGYRDAWTIAYSKKYLVGVWIGHHDHIPMKNISGGKSAAKIAKQVMMSLHQEDADGLQDISFPAPRGYKTFRICKLTGKLASDGSPYVSDEWFLPGTEPVEKSDVFRYFAIDVRNGLLATNDCPDEVVVVKKFINQPY